MKCVLILLATMCYLVQTQQKYPTKNDNFNIDVVLNNRRMLQDYVLCFLDSGECTREAAEAKRYLPDAFTNNCSKCSDKQRQIGKKVLKHIYEKEKAWYKRLEKKYDPTGKYKKRYAEQARKEGINIQ